MMNLETWVQNIKQVLIEISDIDFQKKYWVLGSVTIVSSFEETINRLYDDLNFDYFINLYAKENPGQQKVILELQSFRNALNIFLETLPQITDPKILLENDEWKKIGIRSKELADQLC